MSPRIELVSELAALVMSHANEGRTSAADEAVAAALAACDEQGVEAAGLWYAIAVLEHVRGDLGAQLVAASRCLRIAQAQASPGWASNALSMRAMAHVRGGDVDAALTDLASAEAELVAGDDGPLRAWAHTGLGYCYLELRLYELAQPHLEAAEAFGAAGGSSPMPLVESLVIDQRNLAELHLRWADELERVVPSSATAADVAQQRERGRAWAGRAAATALELGLSSYARSCELMQLSANADQDPHTVVPALRAALDDESGLTHYGERALVGTALARALRADGDQGAAVQAAREAVRVAVRWLDWQVVVAARHLLVELEADAGVPGAVNGRDYARVLTETLWQQRLRTLQGARSAVEVEQLRRSHAQATLAARQDPLTSLGNRRVLDEALAELAGGQDDRRHHSLVLVDLDEFKAVNDAYGHVVGDAVLCAVADAIRASAREDDVLVRLGGDEFVVLARGAGPDAGTDLARRVQVAVAGTAWGQIAPGLRVSASVGVATTGAGVAVAELVKAADAAMYARKPPALAPR